MDFFKCVMYRSRVGSEVQGYVANTGLFRFREEPDKGVSARSGAKADLFRRRPRVLE